MTRADTLYLRPRAPCLPVQASIEHNQDIPICSHCRFYGNGCMRFSEAVRQKAMPDRPAQGLIRHGFLHSASASTRALWAHMPPGSVGGYLLCRTAIVQPCARLWQYPEVVFQDVAQIFCSTRMGVQRMRPLGKYLFSKLLAVHQRVYSTCMRARSSGVNI